MVSKDDLEVIFLLVNPEFKIIVIFSQLADCRAYFRFIRKITGVSLRKKKRNKMQKGFDQVPLMMTLD